MNYFPGLGEKNTFLWTFQIKLSGRAYFFHWLSRKTCLVCRVKKHNFLCPHTKRGCVPESLRYRRNSERYNVRRFICRFSWKVYGTVENLAGMHPYISALLVVYGTVGFNKIIPLHAELHMYNIGTCSKVTGEMLQISAYSHIHGSEWFIDVGP